MHDGLKSVARAPIVHFLTIGAAVFALTRAFGNARDAASYRIVLTAGHVNSLLAMFQKTWRRPPFPDEMRGLLEEYVKEEIYFREAVAMGMDRDDLVVRRRLRQKIEALTRDSEAGREPSDAELKAFLQAHPEKFSAGPWDGVEGAGAAGPPSFEPIRDLVRNEWFAARRAAILQEQYQRLRARYTVILEPLATEREARR